MINKGGLMKLIRPDKKYIQSYIEANEEDEIFRPVSYTHLRAHETKANLVCRLLLEKKKK